MIEIIAILMLAVFVAALTIGLAIHAPDNPRVLYCIRFGGGPFYADAFFDKEPNGCMIRDALWNLHARWENGDPEYYDFLERCIESLAGEDDMGLIFERGGSLWVPEESSDICMSFKREEVWS